MLKIQETLLSPLLCLILKRLNHWSSWKLQDQKRHLKLCYWTGPVLSSTFQDPSDTDSVFQHGTKANRGFQPPTGDGDDIKQMRY